MNELIATLTRSELVQACLPLIPMIGLDGHSKGHVFVLQIQFLRYSGDGDIST
jgi:hypothetical protein